jgi:hypothetical protein
MIFRDGDAGVLGLAQTVQHRLPTGDVIEESGEALTIAIPIGVKT